MGEKGNVGKKRVPPHIQTEVFKLLTFLHINQLSRAYFISKQFAIAFEKEREIQNLGGKS